MRQSVDIGVLRYVRSLGIKLGSTGCGKVLISEIQMAQGEAIEVTASRTGGDRKRSEYRIR